MERCIFKQIFFTKSKPGFTPGDSATNQLLYITNGIGRALDTGKEVIAVFCDISKAFDRVWHRDLIFKLKQSGISGKLLSWCENYLSDRHQKVVINGTSSETHTIKAGVPQGSILLMI